MQSADVSRANANRTRVNVQELLSRSDNERFSFITQNLNTTYSVILKGIGSQNFYCVI